jgi:predicted dehydrogenase
MTLAALEAGKHVLCEKPTAMNAQEAEEMMRAAEARPDQLTLIDHELRFLPAWRAARGSIGSIGHVRFIEARFSSPSRGDKARAWNWWSDAKMGGGVWGAVGSHFVDAIRYLVGEVEEAQAVEKTFIGERPFEGSQRAVTADDFAAVNLRLTNGAVAVMSFSVVSAVDEPSTITIHGESGGIRLEADQWWKAERGGDWIVQPGPASPAPDSGELPGNSPGGYFGSGTLVLGRALRRALDEGDAAALAPAATFVDGWKQQKVLDAARRSSAGNGSWERV